MKNAWIAALGATAVLGASIAACGSDADTNGATGATGVTGATTTTSVTTGQGTGGGTATSTGAGGQTGVGGGTQTSTGQGGATTGQGGATGAGGGGNCFGCADVVQNGEDPALLCTMNGPPTSSEIFDDFVNCLCVTGCSMECDNVCNGMQPDQACQDCALSTCNNEVQACFADGGPPPACIGCGDALGGGDPADLCTMNGPPSSSDLFTAFYDCACVNDCANDCTQECNGGMLGAQCQQCLGQSCATELNECQNDGAPPPPPCESCSEALQSANPNACDMNGPPSSQDLLDAFLQCTCVDQCANQCANACMGGQASNPCQMCVLNNCDAEFTACNNDMP